MVVNGWRLVALTALALLACAALFWLMAPDPVTALRASIRLTARSSLLLFCLAFTASAAGARWPGAFTRWQRHNRRYIGLSFRCRMRCTARPSSLLRTSTRSSSRPT